ncbi:hypothetical protein ACJX0J_033401, partial [Zea mays]
SFYPNVNSTMIQLLDLLYSDLEMAQYSFRIIIIRRDNFIDDGQPNPITDLNMEVQHLE